MNKAFLTGNLGADPELKHTPSGKAVAEMRLATSKRWTNAQGEAKEKTVWHRLVAWGKLGETLATYLRKGSKLGVVGEINTRTWEDRDGNKKHTTEIVVEDFEFLSPKKESGQPPAGQPDGPPLLGDDDVPF